MDPNAPRYRTCCCHVKTCAIIIGVLQAIEVIGNFVRTQAVAGAGREAYWVSIGGLALGLIFLAIYFYGLVKERAGFLIPEMVFLVIVIIGCIANVVLESINAVKASNASHECNNSIPCNENLKEALTEKRNIHIGAAVSFGFGIFLNIYFFYVVYRCYQYFKEKATYGLPPGMQMHVRA